MPRLPIHPGTVYGIVNELKTAVEDFRPLLVGGAPAPAHELRAALVEGGDAHAARDVSGRELTEYDLEGAGALLYVLEGSEASAADEQALRRAARKDVGAVCVLVDSSKDVPRIPYVLATDIVSMPKGRAVPIEEVGERVAAALGDKAYVLAAKLPALRKPVCDQIVDSFARKNGILGVAVFVPGADLPVLTLNQIRMVMRIAAAYGERLDRERVLEILAVVGAGFGLRALARQLLAAVPGPGWAYKGAIAYAGTKAIGEAAVAFFEAGGPSRFGGAVRSGS